MLSNYSDLAYVFNLDVRDFIELVERMLASEVEKAEKEVENKLYFRWVMDMLFAEEPMNFQKYKERAFEQAQPKKQRVQKKVETSKEITDRFERISQAYQESR